MNAPSETPASADADAGAMVAFIADYSCPWCYLGFRRLLRAGARPSWRPFLLNPAMPAGGMDRALYLRRKFGDPRIAARMYGQIAALGAAEGVPFAFEQMRVTPNSVAAQATTLAVQEEAPEFALPLMERFFAATFVEGLDIGAPGVIGWLAGEAGAPEDTVRAAMVSRARAEEVRFWHRRAAADGVTGVPTYVFGGRHAIAGAQPVEILRAMAELGAAETGRASPERRLAEADVQSGSRSGDQAS